MELISQKTPATFILGFAPAIDPVEQERSG